VNSVILMGRLTRDPDIRWTQGPEQKCVARFTLAVDRRMKKQEGQQEQQTADFPACVAFGKTAEFIEKYVQKGTKLVLSGRIRTGSYTDRDGNKVYTTDVIADNVEFAESKKTQESGENGSGQKQAAMDDGFMNIPDGVDDEGLPFN
jgi:single-strand DNA-binding protein